MFEANRGISIWKNAWRVRALALACIILFVGIGSQVLVNAFASSATTNMAVLSVTATAPQEMRMSDGRWAYAGACAVSQKQFPLGTVIALYNQDGTFNRQCTAEDASSSIEYGHISLIMLNTYDAKEWGVRYLLAHIERWGWGQSGPPVIKPTSGLVPVRTKTPLQIFHPGSEHLQP
ncbi:MAG TPA: hypothetical protein VKV40_10300 [Ktedonobacteraceae bacterium]|nr:hypothetical protein [Ktedonobacteraceae bacterium]